MQLTFLLGLGLFSVSLLCWFGRIGQQITFRVYKVIFNDPNTIGYEISFLTLYSHTHLVLLMDYRLQGAQRGGCVIAAVLGAENVVQTLLN